MFLLRCSTVFLGLSACVAQGKREFNAERQA